MLAFSSTPVPHTITKSVAQEKGLTAFVGSSFQIFIDDKNLYWQSGAGTVKCCLMSAGQLSFQKY